MKSHLKTVGSKRVALLNLAQEIEYTIYSGGSRVDRIKVLVIDEQAFFRAGVREALSKQADFTVVEGNPADDPMSLIETHSPDVVLLGSDLTAPSGLELGRRIARYYPNTRVIMLSPDPNDEELFEAIKSAAVACLNKNVAAEELGNTIKRAFQGEYPINETLTSRPMVARHVLNQFQDIEAMGRGMERVTAPLTQRETQILNYVADGNTNKQIAHYLGISEQTIKSHVSVILRKLNANDRAHAVAIGIRDGWLSFTTESSDGNSSDSSL
jgi:DNA-binding NarL/FixJ family response regulator